MRLLLKTILLLFMAWSSTGCAISHKFGPYRGQVLDAETDKPIAGAVVYMEFYTKYSAIVDAGSSYVDSREALTDEQGKFDITYRGLIFRLGHLWDWQPNLCIFKPGYATYPGNQITTITPEPEYDPIMPNQFFTIRLPKLNTRDARIKNLRRLDHSFSASVLQKKLLLSLKNEEHRNLGIPLINYFKDDSQLKDNQIEVRETFETRIKNKEEPLESIQIERIPINGTAPIQKDDTKE